jgi:hypothetical protein
MTTTMKYAPNGKTYELHQYEDPYPDKGARDRIHRRDDCGRCGGSGIYRWHTYYGEASGGCFGCWGTGKIERSSAVSTLRKHAKQEALWAEYGDELRAYHDEQGEIARAAQRAAEFAEHWDEAHAEQDRRAALVQGFLGEIGEKVANIPVTIRFAKYNEGAWNRSATMFIIAETDSGQIIKISGSSQSLFGLERGQETVILSAKVKDHGEYQGQQQTILFHVKIDDFDKRAARCMAYGITEWEDAVDREMRPEERERFEAYVEAQRAEYEDELLGAS